MVSSFVWLSSRKNLASMQVWVRCFLSKKIHRILKRSIIVHRLRLEGVGARIAKIRDTEYLSV